MRPDEFIASLSEENERFFAAQPKWATSYWAVKMTPECALYALRTRFWNEQLGAESIARFMLKLEDLRFRTLVGRQVGDEAKHAFYVRRRIEQLGSTIGEPLPEQRAFFEILDGFSFPEEYFAAQQFTVETQSLKRNEQALQTLDAETALMFRKYINDDEHFHVKLGHTALLHYCSTDESQQRARSAARSIRDAHVAMSVANHKVLVASGLTEQ